MAIVPYTSTNQAGATIFFQRHSQSGEGDDAADAVVGVVGLVDSAGNEIGAANPLPVSVPATRVFASDLTLDTSAYANGDVLGDLLEITSAVVSSAGTGSLLSVSVVDYDDQGQPFDILLFNQSIAVGVKNAAWAVSDAIMANFLGIIRVTSADYIDLGGNRVATVPAGAVGLQPNSGTSIFVATISRGTGTYTANGLRLIFTIQRDG